MVWRNRRVALLEIGWRWAFGLGAIALIFAAAVRLLRSVPVTNGDIAAFHSRNQVLIAAAALHVWQHSGTRILPVLGVLAIAMSLLWLVLSAAGRIVALEPLLDSDGRRNHAGIFGLSFLRLITVWLALLAGAAVIVGAAFAATEAASDAAQPVFALYFLLVLIGLPLVLLVWGVVNWYLSLAAIFCLRDALPAFQAAGLAWRLGRQKGSALFRVSSAYAVPRLVALVVLIALAAIAAAGLAPRAGIIAVILLSLAYFAFSGFLYIARLAAYLIITAPMNAPNISSPEIVGVSQSISELPL